MKKERLMELAGIQLTEMEEFEDIIDEIRDAFEEIQNLEIFADNYPEIIEKELNERDELLSAIDKMYEAARLLEDKR